MHVKYNKCIRHWEAFNVRLILIELEILFNQLSTAAGVLCTNIWCNICKLKILTPKRPLENYKNVKEEIRKRHSGGPIEGQIGTK